MSGSRAPRDPKGGRQGLSDSTVAIRIPVVVATVATLVLATVGGLQRIGWEIGPGTELVALHGPLMVCGVFGSLISLERAVALGAPWAYAGPVAAVMGSIAALAGAHTLAGVAWFAAALLLTAASIAALRRVMHAFTIVLVIGATCWAIGAANAALGQGVETAVPWWIAFLVLTIAAERLELSRFLPQRANHARVLLVAITALLLGAMVSQYDERGWRIAGGAAVTIAAWLARHDVIRRTIRSPGLPRYIAVCLASGYAWLAASGSLLAAFALSDTPLVRDAALHAIFLGFVFSMVFGHAPIILPAVARLRIDFSPFFYLPLFLLHVSVATRVASDLGWWLQLRRVSGALAAIALVVFAGTMAVAAFRGARTRRLKAPI